MDLESVYHELRDPLTRRLERMVGDPRTAEDLRQEAFTRAWKSAPRDAGRGHLRAWVHRTAHNLAVDELRRRGVREMVTYDDELAIHAATSEADDRFDAVEALETLTPHERLVLLLRFEAGLSHAELGRLLAISEEAARKRVSRARDALAAAQRRIAPRERPLVLVLLGDEDPAPYRSWIEAGGGEPRLLDAERFERELIGADALVITGSETDIHPELYGQANRGAVGDLDLERDRRHLGALRAALTHDVPIVGICRGHQLLNIAFGGTLDQDIGSRRGSTLVHREAEHAVATGPRSLARRLLGRGASVTSGHHQAALRVGRGLRVTSASPTAWSRRLSCPSVVLRWASSGTPSASPGTRPERASRPRSWRPRDE